MRHLVLFAIVLVAGALAACGPRIEKRFPGGDPYDVRAEVAGPEGLGPEGIIEEPEPQRPVILPRNAREQDGIVLSTRLPSTRHAAGTPLRVTLVVQNTTRNTVRLTYNTAQRFDLFVFPSEDSNFPLFIWSEHQHFPRDFQEHAVGGGASVMRVLEIPTTANPTVRVLAGDDRGAPLVPGVYYLWSVHEGGTFLADGPIRFEIYDPAERSEESDDTEEE